MTSRSRVLVLSLICAAVVAVAFALTRSSAPAQSAAAAPDSVRRVPEEPRALELAPAVTDPTARARIGSAWQVRVLDPKRARLNQSSSSDGPEDAPPIAWDCRVSDGAVTTHDVVVSAP